MQKDTAAKNQCRERALRKGKEANEIKQNINKKVNNDNGGQANNHRPKTINVCGRYVNHKCWKGEDCTLEHPVMCDSDVYRKVCGRIPCDLYHPPSLQREFKPQNM